MHPSSSRAFQRHQEHYLKHPGSVDLITTKQIKLPSFIHRLVLGHVLSKEGRQPNPKKIEAIVECTYKFSMVFT
jgi:hypothetical protein